MYGSPLSLPLSPQEGYYANAYAYALAISFGSLSQSFWPSNKSAGVLWNQADEKGLNGGTPSPPGSAGHSNWSSPSRDLPMFLRTKRASQRAKHFTVRMLGQRRPKRNICQTPVAGERRGQERAFAAEAQQCSQNGGHNWRAVAAGRRLTFCVK